MLTFGLRRELHYGDPQHPMFHRIGLDTKIGFDNPDNVYQIAKIDPGRAYRVTGTRGTVQFLEFSVSVGFRGLGSENGRAGIMEYLDTKTTFIA